MCVHVCGLARRLTRFFKILFQNFKHQTQDAPVSKPFQPSPDILKLFTFATPGFQRAMAAVVEGSTVNENDINDEYEAVADDVAWRSKLLDYRDDISSNLSDDEKDAPPAAAPAK